MTTFDLDYGTDSKKFEAEEGRFELLGESAHGTPLSDKELGDAFDNPIASEPIEDLVQPGESVLLVVPDATRAVGAGQVTNLLVRRLIANGTMPYDISVIIATGLHRKVTQEEKESILTPFIVQRVKVFDHDPTNLMGFVRVGETSSGIPIELNRVAVEAKHVILIGGINFHYFAGFTGGRKLICPGLASKRTVVGTHSLAFDAERKTRANGVGTGELEGNPVNEAFVEAASFLNPTFAFNTFVDRAGEINRLFCGNWKESHTEACRRYLENRSAAIEEKRPIVIVSAGGIPNDINLIQSHKALNAAARACEEGGTIVLVAECLEGAGSREFEKFLGYGDKSRIADEIAENYAVGGQTAWSLFDKAERFRLKLVTAFDHQALNQAGIERCNSIEEALASSKGSEKGFVMPHGAKYLPVEAHN